MSYIGVMIERYISDKFLELQKLYPVVSVTGPRQSGKTTLVKKLAVGYEYINLENLDVLQAAKADPRGLIKSGSKKKLIIDEVQRMPDLLSYIQVEVDDRQIPGQFVITGSQGLNVVEKIGQSLAGRVGNLIMLPLSIRELRNVDLLEPV